MPHASPMNTIKKILIAHHEPTLRRRLVMLLSASGFDVRPFATVDEVLQGAQQEWFDLAVVDGDFSGSTGLTEGLRRIQPTLSQLLVVEKMELGEVVRGIRQGVAEVVAVVDDGRPDCIAGGDDERQPDVAVMGAVGIVIVFGAIVGGFLMEKGNLLVRRDTQFPEFRPAGSLRVSSEPTARPHHPSRLSPPPVAPGLIACAIHQT